MRRGPLRGVPTRRWWTEPHHRRSPGTPSRAGRKTAGLDDPMTRIGPSTLARPETSNAGPGGEVIAARHPLGRPRATAHSPRENGPALHLSGGLTGRTHSCRMRGEPNLSASIENGVLLRARTAAPEPLPPASPRAPSRLPSREPSEPRPSPLSVAGRMLVACAVAGGLFWSISTPFKSGRQQVAGSSHSRLDPEATGSLGTRLRSTFSE